ncbi:hypothetical protein RHGRI_031339 [Rhododendron griersonianum]|uniref:Uncharacterized protein n=1 Tax=Rhododendron griersonianum TaxID=479676 RepID=A0AAV6I895_9ERIC|nr:hypothetical protein RHGRI_031339 [Rhododendron griersonianum]
MRYIIIHPSGISTCVPKPGNYTRTGSIEKLRKLSHYNSNQVPFFETIRWHRGLKCLTTLKREAISVFTGLPNLHKLSALSLLTPVNNGKPSFASSQSNTTKDDRPQFQQQLFLKIA